MHGYGPPKPKEILKAWARNAGIVLAVALLIWGIFALRSRPPVPFEPLNGDAPGLNDGTWDYFSAVAVEPDLSDADLKKLLEYFQSKYTTSDYNRVYIVVFNSRAALLNADMDAMVAEYRQDREAREFTQEIVESP